MGKVNEIPPDSPLPQNIEFMENPDEQDLERIVQPLSELLYETEEMLDANGMPLYDASGPRRQRTKRSKDFKDSILAINNILSFTSEGVGKKDHAHSGWTQYRIGGPFHHMLGSLLTETGHCPAFAQIYTIGNSQAEADSRQQRAPNLNNGIVRQLQGILHKVNPYAQSFKHCAQRIQENPDTGLHMRILQADPNRANRGTHNKPTSDEVAQVILSPPTGGRVLDRDIVVETNSGALQRVPFWHAAYMALRYPLLFPFGELGWHDNIPLRGHAVALPNNHLFADRHQNKVQGTLQNHNLIHEFDAPVNDDAVDTDRAPRGRGGSKRVTLKDIYNYWIQVRPQRFNRILYAGSLFQAFLTDAWVQVELNNLNWCRANQKQLRADLYNGLMDRLASDNNNNNLTTDDVGKALTILPSSFHGGPRWMKNKFQNAMALVTRYGKPDFFITFTCNPNWADILRELPLAVKASERADLIVRVFNQKLKELMTDLVNRQIFGQVVARSHVIEFQKRGLPHAHILIILDRDDRLKEPEDVDRAVRAELPDPDEEPDLYALVTTHMIHGQCSVRRDSPCLFDKNDGRGPQCSKHFPKETNPVTKWNKEGGYAQYRRQPDRIVEGKCWNNQWVVPYNPYLLLKYQAHINVEVCSSLKSVAYLFKYIYKGPDQADFAVTRSAPIGNGKRGPQVPSRHLIDAQQPRDEITEYVTGRWIGSMEASYKLQSFSMGETKPHVEELQIHLPDQQSVILRPHHMTADGLAGDDKARMTNLTEHFAANQLARQYEQEGKDPPFRYIKNKKTITKDPRQYLYTEFPEHFTWAKSDRMWKIRQKQTAIGRMYFINPRSGDLYYLRMLLTHRRGCVSFEELRTIDGKLCGWKEACYELGLIDDDQAFADCLQEASGFATASMLRILYIGILIECQPTNPRALWDKFKYQMTLDCNHFLREHYPDLSRPESDDGGPNDELRRFQEEQYGLYIIQGKLEQASTPNQVQSLESNGLPELEIEFESYLPESNRLIREEQLYTYTDEEVDGAWGQLNADQQRAANSIYDAVVSNPGGGAVYFLNGSGGTGKTFVQNTVMAKLRKNQTVVLAVASSGIAATLLTGGRTAHSRFKIPLDSDETSICGTTKGSNLAELIKRTALIFWDESPMQNKFDMEAVDKMLQDVCSNEILFGGKVVCFCGDFRQCLPVIQGGSQASIIDHCLCNASFWGRVQIFHLTINMRLNNPDLTAQGRRDMETFAAALLDIGNGKTLHPRIHATVSPWAYGHLQGASIEQLLDQIYPRLAHAQPSNQYLAERAILAVRNADVSRLNTIAMGLLQRRPFTCYSSDVATNAEEVDRNPPDRFKDIWDGSMPPHKLILKVGAPVMLLRNLDPPRLCNGSRIRLTYVGKRVLEGEILGGVYANEKVLLPRMPLTSKDNGKGPCQFTRTQFPINTAFAMTVNKSQGQSLKHVGLDLRSKSCFSHGQLYVGLSRVTNEANLKIISNEIPDSGEMPQLANVVWKQVLLAPRDEDEDQ